MARSWLAFTLLCVFLALAGALARSVGPGERVCEMIGSVVLIGCRPKAGRPVRLERAAPA